MDERGKGTILTVGEISGRRKIVSLLGRSQKWVEMVPHDRDTQGLGEERGGPWNPPPAVAWLG